MTNVTIAIYGVMIHGYFRYQHYNKEQANFIQSANTSRLGPKFKRHTKNKAILTFL